MKYSLLLLFALAFYGCDLFQTRSAETPNQPRSNYQPPATPDDLITNFKNSIIDLNEQNYIASFPDSNFTNMKFRFDPSNQAVAQYPVLAGQWTVQKEEQFFNNLITKVNSNSKIIISLNEISRSTLGDSVFYTASYALNIPFSDSNLPQDYQGDLTFKMVRDSRSVWVIYYWQDNKNTEVPSWSELKGRLSY
jgi:hypothetical protein